MRVFDVEAADDGAVFALATSDAGVVYLLVSRDDARTFVSIALREVPDCRCAPFAESNGLAIGTGAPGVVAIVGEPRGWHWVRYASADYGQHVTATSLTFDADAVALAGRRGLAYAERGVGWETNDTGSTWVRVSAPVLEPPIVRKDLVACSATGCLVGASARLGWDLP